MVAVAEDLGDDERKLTLVEEPTEGWEGVCVVGWSDVGAGVRQRCVFCCPI